MRTDNSIDNSLDNLPNGNPSNSSSSIEQSFANSLNVSSKVSDISKQENDLIYLDYNATTPLIPEVKEAMFKAADVAWANPSSTVHSLGRTAKRWLTWSREQIGSMINAADPYKEIVFTSGGTESNNWVLNFVASLKTSYGKPHVIGEILNCV